MAAKSSSDIPWDDIGRLIVEDQVQRDSVARKVAQRITVANVRKTRKTNKKPKMTRLRPPRRTTQGSA